MFFFLLIIVNNFYVCFLKMMNKIIFGMRVIISILNSIKMNIDRNCRNDFFFLRKQLC